MIIRLKNEIRTNWSLERIQYLFLHLVFIRSILVHKTFTICIMLLSIPAAFFKRFYWGILGNSILFQGPLAPSC